MNELERAKQEAMVADQDYRMWARIECVLSKEERAQKEAAYNKMQAAYRKVEMLKKKVG